MKKKLEKGVTGIDVAGGLVIFLIATTAVINIYYQIFVNTIATKVHQVAIGCIVKIFEEIDLLYYEQVTEAKVSELIEKYKLSEYFNEEKNNSTVRYSVVNYSEETGVEQDLIKKINITLSYPVGNRTVNYTINKIKVRE